MLLEREEEGWGLWRACEQVWEAHPAALSDGLGTGGGGGWETGLQVP